LTLRIVSVQLLGAKPSGSGGEQPNYGGEANPTQSYNPAPSAGAESNEAMDDLPF
jgi:hypothetical protein